MTHFIAILFFSGILVGLGLVLQYTISAHWADMVAALLGRPMPYHRPRAVTVQTRSPVRATRHAAA